MIEYIINNSKGSLVYQTDSVVQSNKNNLSVIKQISIEALFSYEGYLKAFQKKFGKIYRIPVYIDEEHMFIPIKRTRDFDNIWINFAAIHDINHSNGKIEVIFESKRNLHINISFKSLKRQINYLEAIQNTKVKHFHF